jgi:hypothetical protein
MTTATPRATPEPTARPTTTDPNATTTPLATLGSQYWPGEIWPPPEALGVQYWPETEHWPPPPACFPESDICIEQAALGTAPPGSVPSTTVAPATTATTALTGVQLAVLAQVGVTEAAYDAALRNPGDSSLAEAIAVATADGSPAREEFVGAYEAHVAEGHWTVPDPDIPNSVTAVGDPMSTDGGAIAFVTVCHVSGDTLMGRDATGDEQLLADRRNAHLVEQMFLLVDGQWRLAQRTLIKSFPEATSCEPEPDQPPASPSPSAPSSSG